MIDAKDFNETAAGQRTLSDEQLRALIQVLSHHRLGLHNVEPDILGRAYEYLLRKFAEGQGQSAGEFYTPHEEAILMAHLLDPQPGDAIYDPARGSGGLLIKSHLRFREKYNNDPLMLVINKAKPHPSEILLINASKLCAKGRPKNYLTEAHIEHIARLYHDWQAEKEVSAVITNAEAARNGYNLSPSRYVASNESEEVLPLEETLVLLAEAEEER